MGLKEGFNTIVNHPGTRAGAAVLAAGSLLYGMHKENIHPAEWFRTATVPTGSGHVDTGPSLLPDYEGQEAAGASRCRPDRSVTLDGLPLRTRERSPFGGIFEVRASTGPDGEKVVDISRVVFKGNSVAEVDPVASGVLKGFRKNAEIRTTSGTVCIEVVSG